MERGLPAMATESPRAVRTAETSGYVACGGNAPMLGPCHQNIRGSASGVSQRGPERARRGGLRAFRGADVNPIPSRQDRGLRYTEVQDEGADWPRRRLTDASETPGRCPEAKGRGGPMTGQLDAPNPIARGRYRKTRPSSVCTSPGRRAMFAAVPASQPGDDLVCLLPEDWPSGSRAGHLHLGGSWPP